MGKFLQNFFWFIVGLVLFFTAFVFAMSFIWRQGGYQWIYQFFVSFGFLLCAFYFFLLSKGDRSKRILWGLAFLVLSPLSFLITGVLFFGDEVNLPDVGGAEGGFSGPRVDGRLLDIIIRAELAPGLPVYLLAILGLLVGNGIFFSRHLSAGKIIGGNILLLAWIIGMYWWALNN